MKNKIMGAVGTVLVVAGIYYASTMLGGSSVDFVKKYTEGYMNLTYLNDSELYIETTNVTKEEADADYQESIEIEMGYFIDFFELEYVTAEEETKMLELIDEVYSKTKYEIKELNEVNENLIEVEMKITPINIIKVVEDALIAKMDASTDAQLDELLTNWNTEIIKLFEDNMSNLGYFDPVMVTVKVYVDSDNLWVIDDNSIVDIDNEVVKYNYNVELS